MFKTGLIHITVAIFLLGSVYAQSFLYSVTLSDSNGQIIPLNTTFAMVQIGLWPDSSGGGAPNYTENFGNVLVTNGVFEIFVGDNGSTTVLPDLSNNQYVEISIQLNSQASMEVLTPRVRLPFLPMAVDSFRVGGLTRADIEASIASAGQSFSANDAVTSVLADPRILQINSSLDLRSINDSVEFSVDDSFTSTKFAILNTSAAILFKVNSIGEVQASTYYGDGSNLSGLVSLNGTQTISGTKTFSDLNTHFLGTVNAIRFVGDGQDLTNINGSALQNNIIDTSKLANQAVTSGNLANESVTQSNIASEAVDSEQIANKAVTNSKLASGSVMSENLTTYLTAPGVFHVNGLNLHDPFIVTSPGLNLPAFHVNSAGQVAILTNQFSRTLNIGGDLEADTFYGDGSNLTGVGGIVTAGSITSEKIATSAVNSSKLSTNIEIDGYLSVGGTILKTLSSIALGEQSNTHVNLGSDSITGSVGVSNSYISITGGKWNTAEANYSFIGGGNSNRTSGAYASVLGGLMNNANGMYSTVLGGQKMTLIASNTIGFNGSSTEWTVTKSSVASFMGVSMGIGTTDPNSLLDLTPQNSSSALIVRTGNLDSLGVLEVSTYVRIGGLETSTTTNAVLVINGNIKFNDVLRSSWPSGSGSGALQESGSYAFYDGDVKIGGTTAPLGGSTLDILGKVTAFQFEGDGSLLTGISGGSTGANSITSSELASDAVTSGNISDDAIETSALTNLSVTTAKIALSAVTSGSIQNFSITSNDLASNFLTQSMLARPLVTGGSFEPQINLNSTLYIIGQDSFTPFEISTSNIAQEPAIFFTPDGHLGTHTRGPQAWVEHIIPPNPPISMDVMRVGTNQSSPSLIVSSSGNVGINVVQPSAGLHVFSSTTSPLRVSTGIDSTSLYVGNSGYVGIGMSSPSAALHVISSSADLFRVSTSLSSAPRLLISSNNLIGINTFQPSAAFHIIESSSDMLRVGTSDISVPTLLVSSNGNIGVNSFQPSAAFQITESSNDVFRAATTEFAVPAFLVTSNNTVGINHFQPSAALHVLESGTNALIIATSALATPALLVTSDNKVGINNFQPSAAFHVIESSADIMRVGTSLTSNPTLLVTSNNQVGINHPLPSAAFHVIESSTDPMMIGTTLQSAAVFAVTSNGRVGINTQRPIASLQVTGSSTNRLIVGVNPAQPDLIIDHEGYVTIGAYPGRTPGFPAAVPYKLTVSGGALCVDSYTDCVTKNASGNADSEGTIYAETTVLSGSDYAEYFPAEEVINPGEVVGVNPKNGKVRRYRSGDILIGIISTSPGVVGNSFADKDTHSLVALMGQVPVVRDQVMIEDGLVYTLDGKAIGSLLSDGKVYINIGSESYQTIQLKQKIKDLEERLSKIQKQINFIIQNRE